MHEDYTEDVLAKIGAFAEFLAHIDAIVDNLSEEVSKIDLEQQDVLHEIERLNFNASQGYMLTKKLQNVRKRRRIIKNQWEVVRMFRDGFANHNKTLHVSLYKTLTKMRQLQEVQGNRRYFPRIANN